MDELMTAKDVAKYLRLNKKNGFLTVYRWAKEGKLRAGKAGDMWRFKREDVDDFMFQAHGPNYFPRYRR